MALLIKLIRDLSFVRALCPKIQMANELIAIAFLMRALIHERSSSFPTLRVFTDCRCANGPSKANVDLILAWGASLFHSILLKKTVT